MGRIIVGRNVGNKLLVAMLESFPMGNIMDIHREMIKLPYDLAVPLLHISLSTNTQIQKDI